MGDALVSEFLIALFAVIVVVLTFRRNTPRPVELLAWGGLIWVCIMGVTATREEHARALTAAAVWGAGQMVGTLVWLGLQGVIDWIAQRRFMIADWVVLLFGVDLLVLVLLSTRRQGLGWRPRVRLRDWMELPRPARPQPARVIEYGPDQVNRKFNVWAPMAAASAMTWITLLLIWTGDVVMPSAARRLRRAAASADGARRHVGRAAMEPRHRNGVVALANHARDALNELGSAPQIDWLGGVNTMPRIDGGIDDDGNERDRRHRLAS